MAFAERSRRLTFEPGVGLPGRVWAAGEPAWIPDVTKDSNFPRLPAAAAAGLHAGVGFPIRLAGQVLGVMEFFSEELRGPDEHLLRSMAVIGSELGQLMERLDVETLARRREARYEAIVASALDCVIGMDHAGRIIEFNPAAERTFGLARSEAIGRLLGETIVPEELRADHIRGLARYLQTGDSHILDRRLELTALRADGETFPVELTVTRIDGEGPPTFTGFVRDITDRTEAEAERLALIEREHLALEAAQRAGERLAFLAEASDVLGASLDYQQTLRELGLLIVPRIADWYAVDLVDDRGALRNVAVSHADPRKVELAQDLRERYPPDPAAPAGTPNVIRTGRPELYPEVDDAMLEAAAIDEEQLLMVRQLALRSVLIVPLIARGTTMGAMTLVTSESNRRYADDDVRLAEELAERAAIAIDNARLYGERDHIARVLQESLLPPSLPTMPGFEIASYYRPSRAGFDVGGDFYDVFQLADGDWAVLVGDVCGKGPEAAAVTGLVRHSIRTAAMTGRRPGNVLAIANREMLRQELGDRFCSVVLMRVHADRDGATLRVSTGGHPLPIVRRADGGLEEIREPGMLLGIDDDAEFSEVAARLDRSECVILFTDGLADGAESQFTDDRLASVLSSAPRNVPSLVASVERLVEGLSPDEHTDDVAVVVLGVVAASGAKEPASGDQGADRS